MVNAYGFNFFPLTQDSYSLGLLEGKKRYHMLYDQGHSLFPFVSLQLCEFLEELLNANGKLRSEGQAMWSLLGGILGQVRLFNHCFFPTHVSAVVQTKSQEASC